MAVETSFSQTALFTEVPYTQLSLSQPAQTFLQNVSALSSATPHYVQIGSLPQLLQNSSVLNFTIPGVSGTFTAQTVMVSQKDAQTYTWAGKIDGNGNGNIMVSSSPNGITGFISLSTQSFSLYPLENGYGFLLENGPENSECATIDAEESSSAAGFCAESDCAAIIDILVLVTVEVQAFYNTLAMPDFAGITNLAFQNSGIQNKQVRVTMLELRGAYPLSASIGADVNALANNPNIQALREGHRADIVVLLTNQGYVDGAGFAIFGQVAGDNQLSAIDIVYDLAFAIVEIAAPPGRFTFTHEVAHALGARHNRTPNGGNDNTIDCAHGLRFIDEGGTERRTVMALLGAGTRILHFSNPDVEFNGVPTGLGGFPWWNQSNNADKISNAGCVVAEYEASHELGVVITNPSACTFAAEVIEPIPPFPGFPPYSYQWRLSFSPFFTGNEPVISTSSNVTVSNSFFPRYLQVIVTSVDGISVSSVNFVKPSCSGPMEAPLPPEDGITTVEAKIAAYQSPGFVLYPNPASGIVTLAFLGQKPNDIQIESIDGRIIHSKSPSIADGLDQIELDISSLSAGVYFVKCQFEGKQQTQKFIIQSR